MSIDRSSLELFSQQPDHYVLRVEVRENKNILTAEEKGVFTWIKSHLPWMSSQYKLDRVVATLKNITEEGNKESKEFLISEKFSTAIRRNIARYNEPERKHKHIELERPQGLNVDKAKAVLQELQEFKGDHAGMYCMVSDRLIYLDKSAQLTERRIAKDAKGIVTLLAEKGKKAETFETFHDLKVALGLSDAEASSTLQALQSRLKEIYDRLEPPLTQAEKPRALERLESIKKALGNEAIGTYFLVENSGREIELVFLDDHCTIRSGLLEIAPRSLIFEQKEFTISNLLAFYKLKPLVVALFKSAFKNANFIINGKQDEVVAALEKNIQTFGKRADREYTFFTQVAGGKEKFFLAYVKDQHVKIVPLEISLKPPRCFFRDAAGQEVALLTRTSFKNEKECKEHIHHQAKLAGIYLSDQLNIKEEMDVINYRKHKLLEAAGQKKNENVEAEFEKLLEKLAPAARIGAFIMLQGATPTELKIKVVTSQGMREHRVDIGLARGKYVSEGHEYTLEDLLKQLHLTQNIKALRKHPNTL